MTICRASTAIRSDAARRQTMSRYGEGTAMLAGDGMQAKAFSIAAENTHVGTDAALDALRALAHAAGPDGMVGGQMLDLIGESRRLSRAELLHMNTLKTCRFISVACELGCIAAGADKGCAPPLLSTARR